METTILYWCQRWWNGIGKLLAGLTPGGENLWPGVQNDLYFAHLSIYCFAAEHVRGKRVLDAGCGAGYGSAKLIESGAAHVVAVDLDKRNIRYSRKHYKYENLQFEIADCETLDFPDDSFDYIVSSNVMEHLVHPENFLVRAGKILTSCGQMILAIPCIVNDTLLAENQANPHHRSNFTVDHWLKLFSDHGWNVQIFQHTYPGMIKDIDFTSPFRSKAQLEAFEFTPTDRDGLYSQLSLTGVYLLSRPDF
jgi:SAM-dependent methyltransferase